MVLDRNDLNVSLFGQTEKRRLQNKFWREIRLGKTKRVNLSAYCLAFSDSKARGIRKLEEIERGSTILKLSSSHLSFKKKIHFYFLVQQPTERNNTFRKNNNRETTNDATQS